MIAYSYDNSGLYIGSTDCQIDPIESEKSGQPVYLLPASATFEPPMERTETKVPIFNGAGWQLKTCNRGTWEGISTKTRNEIAILELVNVRADTRKTEWRPE